MDATPLPHLATAASLLIGVGLRMSVARQAAGGDERAKGLLAGLTILALGLGVAVALWSGNYAALTALDPNAIGQAVVDLSAWVLGVGGPLLAPKREVAP